MYLGPVDFYVYCWTNTLNGKRYIGKGRGGRARLHLSRAKCGRTDLPRFYRALRKYGAGAFELGFIATGLSDATARSAERTFIQMYDTQAHGYNLTDGGEGLSGASLEVRAKISAAQKGRPKSPEARANMSRSNANRGKPLSEETKRKLSESKRGRRLSQEHRARLSEAGRGRTHSQETKKKMGDAHRGKSMSQESRQKLSLSKLALGAEKHAETERAVSEFTGYGARQFALARGLDPTRLIQCLRAAGWVLVCRSKGKWARLQEEAT